MSVMCLECKKIFKKQLTSHLSVHGMNKESYLKKYPGAKTIDETLVQKFKGRVAWNKGGNDPRILKGKSHPMYGREHTEESKQKNSETHLRLYAEDKEYRKRVSEGTKKGMRKPEVWNKFMNYIQQRDISGESNPFYGRAMTEEHKSKIYTDERNEKISNKRKEWWSDKKGKTVEALYGEETGQRIKKIKSEQNSGERNPAYGKVYENTGSCKVGKYKGQLFRGILEYSYLKLLDKNNMKFEYEPFSISYVLNGVNRTYHPDFLVGKKLIEVKASFLLTEKYYCIETNAKKQAAEKYCEENGLTYQILTEKDFPVLTCAQAYADLDVEWIRK